MSTSFESLGGPEQSVESLRWSRQHCDALKTIAGMGVIASVGAAVIGSIWKDSLSITEKGLFFYLSASSGAFFGTLIATSHDYILKHHPSSFDANPSLYPKKSIKYLRYVSLVGMGLGMCSVVAAPLIKDYSYKIHAAGISSIWTTFYATMLGLTTLYQWQHYPKYPNGYVFAANRI